MTSINTIELHEQLILKRGIDQLTIRAGCKTRVLATELHSVRNVVNDVVDVHTARFARPNAK